MTSTHSMPRLDFFLSMVIAALFLVGCGANNIPAVDWNSRIGGYTYDQAVADLGVPLESKKLVDGGTMAEWLSRQNDSSPAAIPMGGGLRAGGVDAPVAPSATPAPKNRYLDLTFDIAGKLAKWDYIYR